MAALTDKRALITGGASGLGLAIAELFVERGAKVMLADIDADGATRVAAQLGDGAAAIRCDVTDEAQVQAAVDATVETLGGLEVVVNNAGVETVVPLALQDVEDFRRIIDVNVTSVFLGIKHGGAALAAAGGGVIVNLASAAGLNGAPGMGAYAASKAGVVQLTRVGALELREAGVRVNAICPGIIETPMAERSRPAFEAVLPMSLDELIELKQGRWGAASEVAELAAFLASGEAALITGAAIAIDGGFTASIF